MLIYILSFAFQVSDYTSSLCWMISNVQTVYFEILVRKEGTSEKQQIVLTNIELYAVMNRDSLDIYVFSDSLSQIIKTGQSLTVDNRVYKKLTRYWVGEQRADLARVADTVLQQTKLFYRKNLYKSERELRTVIYHILKQKNTIVYVDDISGYETLNPLKRE